MPSPYHVRRIEIFHQNTEHQGSKTASLSEEATELSRNLPADGALQAIASYEWIFEVADESGQTVLAFPFEAAIKPDLPEPDRLGD